MVTRAPWEMEVARQGIEGWVGAEEAFPFSRPMTDDDVGAEGYDS